MDNSKLPVIANMRQEFEEYERPIRAHNFQVCCLVAMIFMPGGAVLDVAVYGWEGMKAFFPVRLLSCVMLWGIRVALKSASGLAIVRPLGLLVSVPPIVSISWMIYQTEGATSPYYAGLNLVMLGAAVMMRWSTWDSTIVVLFTLASYVIASLANGKEIADNRIFFNNLYFLFVTGVIVVVGTWVYTGIRFSEFLMRLRLDDSRHELQEANARLEENYEQLREIDEVKSRLFANVSHELRTPLTLLIAPLEAMINRAEDLPREEMKDMLMTMRSNAMRLLKLINDLLDLVRIESGQIKVQRTQVDIADFIRDLADAVSGVVNDKKLRLRTEVAADLVPVFTDAEKLERICLNLLFNAIKFTASGGTLEFTACTEGDMLRIDVKDSGIGIAPDHLPHVFDRFWQADTSSRRKHQGAGIGLSLVKELAEIQGGSVAAESKLGQGTTMIVRLPYSPADVQLVTQTMAPKELPRSSKDEWVSELYKRAEMFPSIPSLQASLRPVETTVILNSKKPLLLIADDEPDMLRFLKSQLSEFFDVLEAVDGNQAVEKAAQFLPDIVLSDMMMPDKDGLQVCMELRERSPTRAIPVVLLTARADEETKIACLRAGASDFIAKPFSMTEVTVRLKNLVESRLYQKELVAQTTQLQSALEQIKETESLLLRNEKLASLGRMSAGLIHEINNPLNYANQGLRLLRDCAPMLPESERYDFLDTINDVEGGVARVVRIVSDLRGFTRVTNNVSQSFELRPVVETTLRFFSHDLKDGIKVNLDIAEGLEVRGDSNHLVQVLVNLVQNALDAMKTKQYENGEAPSISIRADVSETRVALVIRDNGPGIPDEIRNSVFDPFFTTKEVGAGMGLGLAICHRIMADHGGSIDVKSESGVFTEFILEFPALDPIIP
jgi:signal transduction histidine kinase